MRIQLPPDSPLASVRQTVLAVSFLVCLCSSANAQLLREYAPEGWASAGQDLANTRDQFREFEIGPHNVRDLHLKWTFTTGGNVSATPTVAEDAVYFPDLNGNLYAVDKHTGDLIWSHKVSEYNGVENASTRVSPALEGDHLYIGLRSPADLISIDRRKGALEWITSIDSHPAAGITGSPIVYDGVIYIGISSGEEGLSEQAKYPCCTFRGSVVAVNASTGKILWKTYTVPDNGGKPGGYSGASVWSPPAIDIRRNTIYAGTANNYTAPASVVACVNADPSKDCVAHDDYFDSLLAMDLKTGRIKWGTHLRKYDIWTLACIRPAAPRANCPVPSSFDSGSGSGPNIIGDIVGLGQKDGTYWAIDAESGKPIWKTQVDPGGASGGIQWGTATDGWRIYVAGANSDHLPYKLEPSGDFVTGGAWSALDVRTGKILWQTADPTSGAVDLGAVSVANGVMYAGSNSGHMYALDARDGKILWDYNSEGSVIDGPSIVGDSLFWGSGYILIPNNKVFAFSMR